MTVRNDPNVPRPPEELVAACASRACVLYAGPGIGAQAGFPTWPDLLAQTIDLADRDQAWQESGDLRSALASGQLEVVADLISTRLDRAALHAIVRQVYEQSPRRLPDLFTALRSIPFASVLTTNWDDLLERTFKLDRDAVLSPRKVEDFAQMFREERFIILKLHGDLSEVDAFTFTLGEYRKAIFENPPLRRYLVSLFSARTMLFTGSTLEGIEHFVSSLLGSTTPSSARTHFALVPWQQDIDIHKERFLQRWGIDLLVYRPSPDFREVVGFFEILRDRVRSRSRSAQHQRPAAHPAVVERVVLSNIGTFRDLDVDLGRGWNVLLGNNGCGKSTVLKAIALGLCGDDEKAASAAGRLLRAGAATGFIEVSVGENVYRSDLIRDSDNVRVVGGQLTPLQAGAWVILGFPPLRGVSTRNPVGPSGEGSANPAVGDLLPILTSSVDERVDDLKQWIVNVQLLSEGGSDISAGEANRYGRLRDAFFDIVAAMTPGVDLRFDRLDKRSWQVMVRTDETVVPIDWVSQGTSSMLGWVGTLLQRMYEIYADSDRPEREPALVLVDEIDAHMHPDWQRKLVPLVKEYFPKLQVIATTHSPLIVANLEPHEVVHLRRDDETGRIVAEKMTTSFQGWRADQILTGPAFGLDTTLGPRALQLIEEYRDLLGRKRRSPQQEERFRSLARELATTIPPPLETAEAREALERDERRLLEEFEAEPEEKVRQVLSQAEEFFKARRKRR